MGKVYEHHIGKALYSAANLYTPVATLSKVATHSFSDAMMISCQLSFCGSAGQSSCDRNSGDWFQTVLYGAPESGWPSSDSSWQCYYILGTTTKLSIPTSFYITVAN